MRFVGGPNLYGYVESRPSLHRDPFGLIGDIQIQQNEIWNTEKKIGSLFADRDQLLHEAEKVGLGDEILQIITIGQFWGTGYLLSCADWLYPDDEQEMSGPCGEWTETVMDGIESAGLAHLPNLTVRPVTLFNDRPTWLESNVRPFTTNLAQNCIEIIFVNADGHVVVWYCDNGSLGGIDSVFDATQRNSFEIWPRPTPEAPGDNSHKSENRMPGDANNDGVFNHYHLINVQQAGKFGTGEPASFDEGDFNGDGVFDQFDLVLSLQKGNYQE